MTHNKVKNTFQLRPYLVAITGSFGTGKSLVGNILKKYGYYVIDTDQIVADVLKNKNNITLQIIKMFGRNIVNKRKKKNGYIDKKVLSNIVFNNKIKRTMLESLLHPVVRENINNSIFKHKNEKFIFVLIPLLFETKWDSFFDESWCVTCKKSIQLRRLNKRGFSLRKALGRINIQMSQGKKARLADFIINNSGSIVKTKTQIKRRIKQLVQLNHNLRPFFYK